MKPKNPCFILIAFFLSCAMLSAQPFNIPKTISAADRLEAGLAKAGLPTEFIDLPDEFAYFDWIKDNEQVRDVLAKAVDFLETRLRQ